MYHLIFTKNPMEYPYLKEIEAAGSGVAVWPNG